MSSEYKKLRLDVSKIETAIGAYPGSQLLASPVIKSKYIEFTVRPSDGSADATLQVFTRDDGTSTLHWQVGKNQDVSLQLAQHVKDSCSVAAIDQKPFSLAGLSEVDWHFLVDYMRSSGAAVEDQSKEGLQRYKISSGSDQVFLQRWPSTSRFLMQGKVRALYGLVVTTLSAIVADKKSVIAAQLETLPVTGMTVAGVQAELEELMPCTCKVVGTAVQDMLASSVALNKLVIELPDYTAFVFPALRGLEGYMKTLLIHGREPQEVGRDGFGPFFNHGVLKSGCAGKLGCNRTVSVLEECYDLYNRHRHGLFHMDSTPDLSRTIESREEASGIVYQVITTIEKGSQTIQG